MAAKDAERVTLQTYQNKKGEHRMGLQFARSLGLKIAVGDQNAIDKVVTAITTRIEREETERGDE